MSLRLPRTTRRAFSAVLAVAVLLSLQVPGWASTEQKLEEAKQQAAELDRRIGAAEAELASLAAELDELEVELEAAAADLALAEDLHRSASLAAEEATHRSNKADSELADARGEQEANDDTLQSIARDTYKHGLTALSPELAVFEFAAHEDAEGLADRLHFLQRSMGERTAALDEAVALVVRVDTLADRARQEAGEMEELLEIAEQARADAAGAHARLDQLLADTSVKLKRQDELVAGLESDREAAGARIGELEDRLEQERIERERRERERKEREERERKEREERERKEREERAERERRAAAKPASSSGSGGGSGGSGKVSVGAPSGGLVTVGGITVAASLGPQLESLLNAARADGIVLGGSGYRSPEAQARLRMVNGCPDVYDSPASSCRVPTARPGSSEHEKGLAIDFTYQGQTICFPRPGSQCSGNAAFDWLKANAGSYGLKNLSSEAWHWSTTGR